MWSRSSRYKLRLRVKLDWKKYKESGLVLPPPELGQCKNWRFEIDEEQVSAYFIATWERRMIPHNVSLNDVSKSIEPYRLKN
jgi:hypothetical protein